MKDVNTQMNFSQFDTNTLVQLLKNDLYYNETSIIDENDIITIMEILTNRGHFNNNTASEPSLIADTTWNTFVHEDIPTGNYRPYRTFFSSTKKGIAAILICLIISSGLFLNTAVARDLFSNIANWTNELFQFSDSVDSPIDNSIEIPDNN